MKKYLLLVAVFGLSLSAQAQQISKKFRLPAEVTASDYIHGKAVIKLNQANSSAILNDGSVTDAKLAKVLGDHSATAARKFPHAKPPGDQTRSGHKFVDLTRIYEITYSSSASLETFLNSLLATGIIEYAEPHYLPRLSYQPNDPSGTASGQWHLNKIKAFLGWDISKGDTSVVIGITDTGTETNHPDLKSNVKINYAEPIDGIDNDNDGYIDNRTGYDVAMNDNNAQWQGNPHGVHVSGLAAAATDNATGIAGVGFKCKFLPVKIADASGALTQAYEGIVYAADHGCKVINCSWGGPGAGQLGQDVIDYATINMDALVIAASGNDGQELDFYPASYDKVISVSSTNQIDTKSSFSNFGYKVDVCAPGSSVYSTYNGTSYSSQSGTSMASPVAAGAAGIIRSQFPGYSALQAGQHLKVTCDNIYTLSGNNAYMNKLGTGRISLQKAVTTTNAKSVELDSKTSTDNNDNAFVINDTIRFRCMYTNYLAALTNLTVTLTSTSTYVTVLDGTTTIGAMATMASSNNNADPFTVKINSNAPQNAVVVFKVTFTDGAYTESRYFSETLNVDYINIDINDVATSITSKGKIGYNQDAQLQGLGFTYLGGATQLYEAGLMIGTSSSAVSDVVRGSGAAGDTDFQSSNVVSKTLPSVESDFDVSGAFSDVPASPTQNLKVMHKAFAWTSAGDRKYVIVEYKIANTGTSSQSNLYAGIFSDWDLLDYAHNKAGYDATEKLGYVFSTDSSLYMGVKVLTQSAPALCYSIDNVTGGSGGVDISGGYTTAQKYTTLSTSRANAGGTGVGNDVCQTVSSGPFTIAAGDTATVAFAILAGDDLNDIKGSAQAAQIKYDGLQPTSVKQVLAENQVVLVPNPVNDGNGQLFMTLASSSEVCVEMIDLTGKQLFVLDRRQLTSGTTAVDLPVAGLASGIYLVKVTTNGMSSIYKLSVN